MDLFVFAMLGGSIGWGSSRMMCVTHGTLILIMNVLAGVAGALLGGCFVVPLLARWVRSDFALAMTVVLFGAVTLVTVVTFLRRAQPFGERLG
jgi:uncharacterized membrane protein YeaQ/YmgE (transglycosylase-associated protein family)